MKGQFKDAKGVIRKFKPYIMFLQSEIVCDTKEKLLFFTFIFSMSEGTRLVSSTNEIEQTYLFNRFALILSSYINSFESLSYKGGK